jgi:hypothetical protein
MALSFIGISAPVFLTVAGALIFAISTALFNHFRPRSIWHALLAGGVAALIGMVALSFVIGDSGSDEVDSPAIADSTGTPGSTAEDRDRDGVGDDEDDCPDRAAGTDSGCPALQGITLSAFIEQSDEETWSGGEGRYLKTDNVASEQVTVGGIINPLAVRMTIGDGYRNGVFTLNVQRAYQSIRGRVGITSEPCSGGDVAFVGIRNGEDEPLWPADGRLVRVDRHAAVPFDVDISRASDVILYSEAPQAESSCDGYPGTTVIGWVNTRLLAD